MTTPLVLEYPRADALWRWPWGSSVTAFGTTNALGAAVSGSVVVGWEIAGPVLWDDGEDHDVDHVRIACGTVSVGAGTNLRATLRDVSATLGPPTQGDLVDDETVAIPNGSLPVSNQPIVSGAFSAPRSVAHRGLLCLRLTVDGSYQSPDSLLLRLVGLNANNRGANIKNILQNGTMGTPYSSSPCVEFIATDGHVGVFQGGWPVLASVTTTIIQVGLTNPDEIGIVFRAPCDGLSIGARGYVSTSIFANYDVRLIDADTGTVLATTYADAHYQRIQDGQMRMNSWYWDTPARIHRGQRLRVSLRPRVTIGTITLPIMETAAAAEWGPLDYPMALGDVVWCQAHAGAWTDNPLRRLPLGLMIDIAPQQGTGELRLMWEYVIESAWAAIEGQAWFTDTFATRRLAGTSGLVIPSLEVSLIGDAETELWTPVILQWDVWHEDQAVMREAERRLRALFHQPVPVTIGGLAMWSEYEGGDTLASPDRNNFSGRAVRFRYTPLRAQDATS